MGIDLAGNILIFRSLVLSFQITPIRDIISEFPEGLRMEILWFDGTDIPSIPWNLISGLLLCDGDEVRVHLVWNMSK